MLFPTTLVGSYTRPSWLNDGLKLFRRGEIGPAQFEELKTQAKLLTIKEIEDSGIDIVTDGEQGRTSFYEYLTEQMSGFEFGESRTFAGGLSYTGRKRPVAKVEMKAEPASAREAEFLGLHSARKRKVAMISPFFLLNFCWEPGGYYKTQDSFLEDVLTASKIEARAISSRNVDYVQWDDPGFARFTETKFSDVQAKEAIRKGIDALNSIIQTVSFPPTVSKALHVCWGNYKATHLYDGPLDRIYPELLDLKVDVLFLELASARHEDDVEVFKEYPSEKTIAAGVIDVKTPDVEPVRVVRRRADRLLRYIEPGKLILSTDCGFAPSWDSDRVPRSSCFGKLLSLSDTAKELRSSYGRA